METATANARTAEAQNRSTPIQALLSQTLEAFQTVEINGNLIVLSVLDTLEIGAGTEFGDDYSATPNLWLFAEDLLLSSSFKMKQGVVSSHSLTVAGEAVVDVSGQAGTSADTPNENASGPRQPGGDGDSSGNLSLYLERSDTDLPNFKIAAHGGAGGAGQRGTNLTAGADGGKGGRGGQVVIVTGLRVLQWLSQLQNLAKLSSLDPKKEALQQLINLIPDDVQHSGLIQTLKDALSSSTEETFSQLIEQAAFQLQALSTGYESALRVCVDNSGGAYGVYGDGKTSGQNGIAGGSGILQRILVGAPDEIAAQEFSSFFLVHPSQCVRLLNKVKLMYWTLDPVANPQGVTDIMTLLLRLQARTKLFVDARDDSALVNYYNQNEATVGAIGSVNQLRALYEETTRYLAQIKQGYDLFGYEGNHVPLGSFDFYKGVLDEVLANFSALEIDYNNYFSSLEAQNAQMEDIRKARDKQQSIIATAQSRIDALQSLALKTALVIDGYQTVLTPLKKALDKKITDLGDAVRNFDFNFDSVLQSLTSLAFAPESQVMMLTQGSQFLYDGLTKVTDDKGMRINKDYLVSQLKSVKGDLDSLQEGYRALDNGALEAEDPAAGKLIMDEQQVIQFFSDFYNKFPKELDALQQAFQNYITQIEARNNQILTYNATVSLLLKYHQMIDAANDRKQVLNEQALTTMAPDLPDLLTFLSSSYYAARTQVMDALDLTARAYRFWALSDRNLLAEAYTGKSLPEIDHSALLEAQRTILGAYEQKVEDFGTNQSRFPATPDQQGLIFDVPSYQVDLFKDIGQLMVQIPTALPRTSRAESVFVDMANVRVLLVRVWIDGVKTSDNKLAIHLTHNGQEQITSTDGLVFNFSHEPVPKLFKYNIETKEVLQEANFGIEQSGIRGATTSTIYAALGPFTTWNIRVVPTDNLDLDLSQVTGVQLEFHGTSFSF